MQGIEIKKHPTEHYAQDFVKTILLCMFFGMFGIHRFYTGYTAIGFIQMFSLGGGFIWWIIDLFAICFNKYKDAYGNKLDGYNLPVAIFVLTALAIIFMSIGIMSAPYLLDV